MAGVLGAAATVKLPEFLTVISTVGAVAPFGSALPAFTVLFESSTAVTSVVALISNAYLSPFEPEASLFDKLALTNKVLVSPAANTQFKALNLIVPVLIKLNWLLE